MQQKIIGMEAERNFFHFVRSYTKPRIFGSPAEADGAYWKSTLLRYSEIYNTVKIFNQLVYAACIFTTRRLRIHL